MGTPTQRFQVADLAQWGRLVKSWATHLDYISQGYPNQPPRQYWVNTSWGDATPPSPHTITDTDAQGMPKPWCLPSMSEMSIPRPDNTTVTLTGAVAMTTDQFMTIINAAGVSATMPNQYKNVIVVQASADTILFRLPPKDTLQGSEDDLLNGTAYGIPSFYNALWDNKSPTVPQCPYPDAPGRGDIMQLHANRIGEYTMNVCN
jgi:hypothetical protein